MTSFALGAVLMGWLADRWNVRGVYAAAVLLWSLAGFLTGLAQGFATLLICRSREESFQPSVEGIRS